MDKIIIERVLEEADLLLDTKMTVREIAKKFAVSKSTTHKDLKERLKDLDQEKYEAVQAIFLEHIQVRHLRGGQSTKEKYLRKKQIKA